MVVIFITGSSGGAAGGCNVDGEMVMALFGWWW